MILVVEVRTPKPYNEIAKRACVASHKQFLNAPIEDVIMVESLSPQDFNIQVLNLVESGALKGDFILTRDNIVLSDSFDPHVRRCHKHSMWMSRKGLDTEAMVMTIKVLYHKNKKAIDFEIFVPMVMNAELIARFVEPYRMATVHIRTLYFNLIGMEAERTEDPFIEKWAITTQPHPVVTALGDKCYDAKKCRGWLPRH